MQINHPFICEIADSPAAVGTGEVVPSAWNAPHTILLFGRTVATGAVVMLNADDIVNVNHAGTVTVTGATGRTPWKPYTIKDSGGNAAANNITYTPATGTIDGAASVKIQQNYDSLTIYSDGTNEFIL